MELRDVTLYCISKRYSVYIFIERRDTTLYRLLGFFLVVEEKRTSLNKYEIWRDFFYLKVRSHSTAVISLKLCLGKWDFTQLTIDWKGQYHEICTLDFYDSNQAWPLIHMYSVLDFSTVSLTPRIFFHDTAGQSCFFSSWPLIYF